MRKESKMKNGKRAAATVLAVMMLLAGCGTGNEKVAQGMQAIAKLDYETAIASFEAAAEAGESSRLISRGLGIAYMGLTDYEQAIGCFEEALKNSGGLVENMDYDLNYYLAAAYVKNGQAEEAVKVYDAILAMKPEEADALFLRGNVYMTLDNYEAAKADFDKVIALESSNYDRLIQIYQVLENHGYKEAGQLYLHTAMDSGESKMGAYDKGRILYYLGEYQQACLALEETKEKGGAEAYLYLGRAYEATGDYNYASSVYNTYLSKDDSNPRIYNQLGLCEMAKEDYEKALQAFQAGKNIEDNELLQSLSFNEIVAYEHMGEFDKARELMTVYLQQYPDDSSAGREYDFLSTR